MADIIIHPASFKDPSGFIFHSGEKMYRQVNLSYAKEYDLLMSSGLYAELVRKEYLVAHTEVTGVMALEENWYKTIEPENVPFISYPYEWCFLQLRDAALLTLSILKISLSFGMIIKDATPYNIQFLRGKPVFIDTLSFEIYDHSRPWVAYRQFCNMFLFPLYLEFYLKSDIQKIMSAYLDGIPVDITSRMLPLKSGLNLGVWLHVYLQNKVMQTAKGKNERDEFSTKKLLNLVHHLETIIISFSGREPKSEWSRYYQETILGKDYLQEKEKIFNRLLDKIQAKTVLDLGANDGFFPKIAAARKMQVIAVDYDSRSVNNLYKEVKKSGIENILPLVIDISNPSPAIGFNNQERAAFHDRIRAELVIALALIHHLVIGKNISLPVIACYFAGIAPQLMIEWVPREDEKVQQMLASRKDVFQDYTEGHFEQCFEKYFTIQEKVKVTGTHRLIYLMSRR